VTEEKDDVVELVLGFEIEQQRRVPVLFEDRRGSERRLKAMCLPVKDHAPKRPKCLTVLFPIIGKRSEKLLHLSRRSKLLDDGSLFRSKVDLVWGAQG
jgi:hypothetical protein